MNGEPFGIKMVPKHVVLGEINHRETGAFLGYTALSAPLPYDQALKRGLEWSENKRTSTRARKLGRIVNYVVRSVEDPLVKQLIEGPFVNARSKNNPNFPGHESGEAKAAKAEAARRGVKGKEGGWLYDDQDKPIVQGWMSYAYALRQEGYLSADDDGAWWILHQRLAV